LHSLIENGAPGFIVLVLMIVVPLIQAVKQKRYLLLHFNILIGLLFLTESALELQKGIGFFSIFFGLLYYDTSENGQAAHKFSFYANRG
jgi:O-antigen ligase